MAKQSEHGHREFVTRQLSSQETSTTQTFGPTDPRQATPRGGMQVGDDFTFVYDEDMPRLHAELVAEACDNIVRSQDCYTSLLYLSRAALHDIETLFEASRSSEIKVRWERLWVLSPYFARLTRSPDGRDLIADCINDDLAAVHLLSKFLEHRNDSVKKFFERMHDKLLGVLLEHLVEFQYDPRRAQLLVGIVASFETDPDVLLKYASKVEGVKDPKDILEMLVVKPGGSKAKRLSPGVLRERLETWHRE